MRFTDTEMLAGLVSNNEEILQAYRNYYYHTIRRLVRTNHGREDDARDLFQDVLLVIFQKARSGSFILSCSLSTYLFSVSKLLWLKELEKRKRKSEILIDHLELTDTETDVIEIAEYNERLFIYRQHFEQLSKDCKMVLSLFIEGKSIAEITALMGYKSDQYTRNRRYKCKLSLINKIRNFYCYEYDSNGNYKEN